MIRLAAQMDNHKVNIAGLADIFRASGDTNFQGEEKQKSEKVILTYIFQTT